MKKKSKHEKTLHISIEEHKRLRMEAAELELSLRRRFSDLLAKGREAEKDKK